MTQSAVQQSVVQSAGPAAGRIQGMNHLVMYVSDLDQSVRFYRDILGLKVVRTQPRFSTNALSLSDSAHMTSGVDDKDGLVDFSVRQVFFDMGNGELFSVYELDSVPVEPPASVVSFLWPEGNRRVPSHPGKLDHLAFNVPTRQDVEWFRQHLQSNGVTVSEIVERKGDDVQKRFVSSIYFFDPTGNPLEIATFDWQDPFWKDYDFTLWFRDPNPVPALLESSASED